MGRIDTRIREYVRKYVMSRSPGMYILLGRVINKQLGMDPVEAVIRKPKELLEALKNFYGDDMEAVFVFRSLFLKPLALMAGNPDLDDELYKAAMKGCPELVKALKSYGVSINEDVCGE